MQKVPERYRKEFTAYRRALNSKNIELVTSTESIESKLQILEKTAAAWALDSLPPEMQIVYQRELLEAKYRCIVDKTSDRKFLLMIKDEFDRIGYGYPISWGVIRCDLADLLDQAGEKREATKVRKEVVSEFVKMIDFVQSAVLSRARP